MDRPAENERYDVPGYRLVRPLADGGMGRVFLAEHEGSGLDVAIKIIEATKADELSSGQRLLNEARLLSRINHPHVVTVYECGRLEDGSIFQVMEYVSGPELATLMRARGRFSAAELWPYVKQICLALHAAHTAGIVHRDLKPQNIVVTSESPLWLKIIDFGIALDLESRAGLSDPKEILGTPLFISPEQLRGDTVGAAADIYSLGAMLYWMLSGRPPFRGETLVQVLAAHLIQEAPLLTAVAPDVPRPVATLVERCLAKEARDRPASALELAKAYAEAALFERRAGDAFDAAPGWAAFPQLASTEPHSPVEDATIVDHQVGPARALEDSWLLSVDSLEPTLVVTGKPLDASDEEVTREQTVVQSLEAVFGEVPLAAPRAPPRSLPSSIDIELHMASTLILAVRRQKQSRARRLLRRIAGGR